MKWQFLDVKNIHRLPIFVEKILRNICFSRIKANFFGYLSMSKYHCFSSTLNFIIFCLLSVTVFLPMSLSFHYNLRHNILGLFDVLPNFAFTTIKAKHDY